jgi:DnaJ-class molecular chaperone
MERDYYVILGVPATASVDELQEAYRRLARAYHPDVSGADTARQFHEVQQAWEVLRDAQRRLEYDRQRQRSSRPSSPATAARHRPVARPGSFAEAWFGGLGPLFTEADRTVHLELRMSPSESACGGEVAVELPAFRRCSECGGRRRYWFPCPLCGGRGYGIRTERFTLHVPAGLTSGEIVQVPLEEFDLLHNRLVIHVRILN